MTPFDEKGRVDMVSVARLLAWFEASGCKGAILAGTNGEGPSLSAPEKRDLINDSIPLKGKLELIIGIATPSITEANWLCKQAATAGAVAALVMPPSYFREASSGGIEQWFARVLDASPIPVLLYNFPKRTGFTLDPEMLSDLAKHEQMAGVKDSSGEPANLQTYAEALPGKQLFVGDETLLIQALQHGWTGTISGAANVLPDWLSTIVEEYSEQRESAETKHAILNPVLKAIRSSPQPASHKALLARIGVLERPDVRLPLTTAEPDIVEKLAQTIREATGKRFLASP